MFCRIDATFRESQKRVFFIINPFRPAFFRQKFFFKLAILSFSLKQLCVFFLIHVFFCIIPNLLTYFFFIIIVNPLLKRQQH